MKLEGIAEIELTDVNTGEKETIVEKNLVTNALSDIFSMGNTLSTDGMLLPLTPLFKNALGGVLIFDENIEEKPENLLPPGNINCIGHAGNDAYSKLNERRGSFNESESGLIDNGMKLVWDFASNQSNGSIKCISLTSSKGGIAGYGSENGEESLEFFYTSSTYTTACTLDTLLGKDFSTQITWVDDTSIRVKKYNQALGNYITLTKSFRTSELIDDVTITLESPIRQQDCGAFRIEKNFYYSFCLDSNKNVILLKVKKDNLTIEYVDLSFAAPIGEVIQVNNCFIINNHAFISRYKASANLQYTRVNLSHVGEKESIPLPSGTLSPGWNSAIANRMFLNDNYIIDESGKILKGISARSAQNTQKATDLFENGLSTVSISYSSSNTYQIRPGIVAGYLATINNLSTPILKTSDKTMKITYTLTEKTE